MRLTNPKGLLASACAIVLVSGVNQSWAQGTSDSSGLKGTVISPPMVAHDFTLKDQTGASFNLSSTRGKVVVLSFIYTHCTDICPFVSLKLKDARTLLGADAKNVVFVAVTTDPKRDTVPVVARYSKEIGLYNAWHFVTGHEDEVKKVWTAYGVYAEISKPTESPSSGHSTTMADQEHDQGLSQVDKALATKVIKHFGGGYEVGHSAPFWVVDTKGMVRAILDADALPEEIATDVRVLLK
jgi:protein SCO1/2